MFLQLRTVKYVYRNLLKEMRNTLAGYAEGGVRAKLVMDILLGVDLVSTEPL